MVEEVKQALENISVREGRGDVFFPLSLKRFPGSGILSPIIGRQFGQFFQDLPAETKDPGKGGRIDFGRLGMDGGSLGKSSQRVQLPFSLFFSAGFLPNLTTVPWRANLAEGRS